MGAETLSFEQRIEKIEAKLDKILAEKKLNFTSEDSEIDEIFNLGIENLSKMPAQKLSEYSFIIARYGVYLQKELNKQRGLYNWAKKCMDYIVLPTMSEYRAGYMSTEEVKMKAIRGNDVAKKFYEFILEKDHEIIGLSDLSFDIRKMADSLNELSKNRRYNG